MGVPVQDQGNLYEPGRIFEELEDDVAALSPEKNDDQNMNDDENFSIFVFAVLTKA